MRDPAGPRAERGAGAPHPPGDRVVAGSRRLRPAPALAALLLGLLSCGDGTTEPAPSAAFPTLVSVSPATTELTVLGATVQLSAQVFDQNDSVMTGETVDWSSSDDTVAAVDESGLVTAVGNGTATITATARAASGSATVTVADPVAADRAVLVALYETTNGPNWVNNDGWLTDAPLGEWHGVSVDAGGRVVGLNLPGRWDSDSQDWIRHGLEGSIPPELGNLSRLEHLSLGANELTGSIPPELGNLSSLEVLVLAVNYLTGSIPPELGDLSSLEYLRLYANELTGSVPPELGDLSSLTQLFLSNNALTGAIPPELGNLSNLKELKLTGTALTGAIPPELGNLSALETLWLHENELTGSIPSELGNLSALETLWLFQNDLTGSIPPELGDLSSLEYLELYNNALTGPIPPELGNLSQLVYLLLHENALTGSIPPELGNLSSLEWLWLYYNALTGPIPASFLQIRGLSSFSISGNESLCVPNTPVFLVWLQRIESRDKESVLCGGASRDVAPAWPPDVIGTMADGITGDQNDASDDPRYTRARSHFPPNQPIQQPTGEN